MTDDESSAYPEHVWGLIEAHRDLTDVLPRVPTDEQREELQAKAENLELLSLALALRLPAAVAGHAALTRLETPRMPQAGAAGAETPRTEGDPKGQPGGRLAALRSLLFGRRANG